MGIINGELNGKGINRLGSEWGATLGSGKATFVSHTNGKMYAIFARNYGNDTVQRRLYVSISTDQGNTWSAPSTVTSGYWDDEPSAIQLDLTSTSSLIGIVYVSEPVPTSASGLDTMRRVTIDVNGTPQSPLDPLGNGGSTTHQQGRFPQLLNTPSGFIVAFTPNSSAINQLSWMLNTSLFTDNSWNNQVGTFGPAHFFGSASLYFTSLHIFSMLNTHICALGTCVTAIDYSGSPTNLPIEGTVTTNVYVTFSADFGATWSTPQELTSYSTTPQFDLVGGLCAISVRGACQNDNSIVVSYAEGLPAQYLNSLTPALPADSSMGTVTKVRYMPTKNMLLVASTGAFSGNGGVYVFDLTARTRTRLDSASTPPLWQNDVNDINVSSDETYFVVVSDGSVDIVHMGATTTISSWTVTGLRTTSTPATKVSGAGRVAFDSTGYGVSVGYKSSTSGYVGFYVDASNPTGGSYTDLYLGSSGLNTQGAFIARANDVVVAGQRAIYSISKATGLLNYSLTLGGTYTFNSDLFYDSVNTIFYIGNQITGSDQGILKINDSGTSFTSAGMIQTTPASPDATNPSVIGEPESGSAWEFPGIGRSSGYIDLFSTLQTNDWYSYADQAFYGPISHPNIMDQHEPGPRTGPGGALKGGNWRYYEPVPNLGIVCVPLVQRGRLRYGFFPYNASTHQLVTSGVNFYDVMNQLKVDATTFTTVRNFAFIADANNQLYYYFARGDLTRSTLQYYAYNGIVETQAFILQCRARIIATTTRQLQMKSRIQKHATQSLQMRAAIVHAVCLMMRAHIVPVVTQRLQMRARIQGYQNTSFIGNFNVLGQSSVFFRGSLTVLSGYASQQSMTMRARIAPVSSVSFTGSFLVSGIQATKTFLLSQTQSQTQQILRMRAFITR